MPKNTKHLVATAGTGTTFYAIPTGNRLSRGTCPFVQAIKIKSTKVARVNAEFQREDTGSLLNLRLHHFHLNDVYDEANGGYKLYATYEELNHDFKIASAGIALRNWDTISDELRLKVADAMGIPDLENHVPVT